MTEPVTSQINTRNTGNTRIIKAGSYSLQELSAAWSGEAAFRQECLLALIVVPVIVLLDLAAIERCVLVLVTALVLIVDLLNSAIESVVDRIGLEHHVLLGQAKDMGSAAVLVSSLLWCYIWFKVLINA